MKGFEEMNYNAKNKKKTLLSLALVLIFSIVGLFPTILEEFNKISEQETSIVEINGADKTTLIEEEMTVQQFFSQGIKEDNVKTIDACDFKTTPLPNNIYNISAEGDLPYFSKIDEKGRVDEVFAENIYLKKHEGRFCSSQATPKGLIKGEDDRGHLIADVFGGNSNKTNIVAQKSSINRVDYKRHENLINKTIKNGGTVENFHVIIEYENGDDRPKSFIISYVINGEFHSSIIANE